MKLRSSYIVETKRQLRSNVYLDCYLSTPLSLRLIVIRCKFTIYFVINKDLLFGFYLQNCYAFVWWHLRICADSSQRALMWAVRRWLIEMYGCCNVSLDVGCQSFRSKTLGCEKPRDKIKENAPRKGVFPLSVRGGLWFVVRNQLRRCWLWAYFPSILEKNLTQITQIPPFCRFWTACAVRLHRCHPGVANAWRFRNLCVS
jgi:hypothetical protein